ncbi:MAG TPA: FHA domain-containing protein [Thauera sp.]|uniref:FHA domain-containing protein n=1 Tax=Thauera sp. TaxID=1905334 RepID=UPI002CFBC508|nr:FHA domain-containing protein [Thauera sp.]HRP22376.1 FHA domain-containing protein [Thauera sp.]HRP65290.1 FHA domain-containing protein [Thauera sp.]
MSERKNLCVLVALHRDNGPLATQLGEQEALHAAERCANRIERAIAAQGGRIVLTATGTTIACFERCDAGVLAAHDALQRIRSLPPLRGARQPVRLGLHYGIVELTDAGPAGEGVSFALELAALCATEQALASATAAMLLTSSARPLLSSKPLAEAAFSRLPFEVFAIGQRGGLVTSIPPTARLSQRLRLRHQEEVLFVEEQRPVLLLGRELGNDLAIMDPRASRQHARIERRREGFVLFDQSTNGTFVALDGQPERCIKQDKLVLNGPGRIGCGFSANEIERDLVFFDIV